MNLFRRCLTRIMFAVLATLPAGQLDARTVQNTDVTNQAEAEIKPLLAMISCRLGEEESFGSGIVFGSGSDRLYIATANHVVRKADQEARNIRVLLSFLPGETLSGKLLSNYDGKLDIAVLAITDLKQNGVDVGLLHFDRLGTSSNVKRGDPLYSFGYPQKRPWQLNVVPDRLAERAGDILRYESNFVKEGHSGGAVLNENRELIGMIIKDSSLYIEAISIDRVLLALRNWGYAVALQRRFQAEDLEVLSAGSTHTCYSSVSGISYCWGDNRKGQLGNGTFASSLTPMAVTGRTRFISISAGGHHTCGLDTGGRAYCWGENEDGQLGSDAEGPIPLPAAVSGGLTFKFLRAGEDYTCGLTVEDVAYCWGDNTYGQLGNHSKQSSEVPLRVSGDLKFNSLSLGTVHTCGIAVSGITYCWGSNGRGELGNGSRVDSDVPARVAGNLSFRSISVGGVHTCGITTEMVAYCWGDNEFEQLGSKSPASANSPIRVPGKLAFKTIAVAQRHTCGITTAGAAYCWGTELAGELGTGDLVELEGRLGPLPVFGGLIFDSITARFVHTCASAHTSKVYCWGSDRYGQLGTGHGGNENSGATIPQLVALPR